MHTSVNLLKDLIAIPSVNPFGKELLNDIYGEENLCNFYNSTFTFFLMFRKIIIILSRRLAQINLNMFRK